MSAGGPALIWCPFGSSEEAERVARIVVDEGLVACANILPQITSIFRWQSKVDKACEIAVLFKTNTDLLDAAITRIENLHTYDVPAILGWEAEHAPEATRIWLAGLIAGDE